MARLEFAPTPTPRSRIGRQVGNAEVSPVIQPRRLAVSELIQQGVSQAIGNIDAVLAEFAENQRENQKKPSMPESVSVYNPSKRSQTEFLNQRMPVSVFEQSSQEDCIRAKERLSPTSSTREYIDFFDRFYEEEGLPKDWYKLQYGDAQVGFSMKKQMERLRDDSFAGRKIWARQAFGDLQGYLIEYVSPYNVFPWTHVVRETSDGTAHLVDPKYGGRRMIDLVTNDERDGAVTSVMKAIDQAVVTGKKPDGSALSNGSMFLEVSPSDASATGLKQDNGKDIKYKDTHIKISQVVGDKLVGFTIQTDFTKTECRELLYRVSGKMLPEDAPVEDYIRSFAIIDPTASDLKSIGDMVGVAAKVRSDMSFGSKNAYKDKTWDQVLEQISRGDTLYEWTKTSQAILKKFVYDVLYDNPSKDELPRYLSATILTAVQAAQMDQLAVAAEKAATEQLHLILPPSNFGNFGEVLKATAAIVGCAGGGSASSDGGIFGRNRSGQVGGLTGESCPQISCACGWEASDAEVASIQAKMLTHCPKCGAEPGKGEAREKREKEEVQTPIDKKKFALAA